MSLRAPPVRQKENVPLTERRQHSRSASSPSPSPTASPDIPWAKGRALLRCSDAGLALFGDLNFGEGSPNSSDEADDSELDRQHSMDSGASSGEHVKTPPPASKSFIEQQSNNSSVARPLTDLLSEGREAQNKVNRLERALKDAHDALEFAQAEDKSAREALVAERARVQSLEQKLATCKEDLAVAEDERDSLLSELYQLKEALAEALEREACKSDTFEQLVAAQRELESAYADAVARLEQGRLASDKSELESWMVDADETDADGEEEESDDEEGQGAQGEPTARQPEAPIQEGDETINENTMTLNGYCVVEKLPVPEPEDLRPDTRASFASSYRSAQASVYSLVPPGTTPRRRKTVTLKRGVTKLLRKRPRATSEATPTGEGSDLRSLAVKELENEVANLRSLLCEQYDAFLQSDDPRRLSKLRPQVTETMERTQIAVTKLQAVKAIA